jgi:hypothetical protein
MQIIMIVKSIRLDRELKNAGVRLNLHGLVVELPNMGTTSTVFFFTPYRIQK